MQYNDTTNKQGIVQDTYFNLTNVTSTQYSANDVKRNINKAYRVAVDVILRSLDNWDFQDTIASGDLVADQTNYTFKSGGDFDITDVITIDRIELSADGTSWYKATRMDRNDFLGAFNDSDEVKSAFSVTSPMYDLKKDSVDIYPVPTANVTDGIKLYYKQDVTDLSADADVPVIAPQFHTYLSLSAAYDYAVSRGLKQSGALRNEMELMKRDMQIFYSDRAKDGNMTMAARVKNFN